MIIPTSFFVSLVCVVIHQGAADSANTHFENRIRPILAERCWKCHGPETARSGLRLDSAAGLKRGGKQGPVIDLNRPADSRILKVIARQGELKMPPDGSLSPAQLADMRSWVMQGAAFPESKPTATADGRHWAFQPLQKVGVDGEKPSIDVLVRNKLQSEGLSPAPPADRQTLARRITLDLTGLPPTPGEMKAFLADSSTNAYEKLVDRLLASKAYGERWGRHWLDVARYADSNGLDENVAHGNAWRYRDYVVNAFNADMPFDQFLREQVAGDLLEGKTASDRQRMLVATGFLVLGPKVLAEVDKAKLEMDIIDEQIDTLGKAFMGMTFGCARCHDHKFDPVSTADYYALAGIFKSTQTMDDLKTVAKWHENPLANEEEKKRASDHAALVAKAKSIVDSFIDEQGKALVAAGTLSKVAAKEVEAKLAEAEKTKLKQLRQNLADLEKSAPVIATAMGVAEAKTTNVAIHIRGNSERLGQVVPRNVPGTLAAVTGRPAFPEKASGRVELANWMASPQNPLTSRVIVNRVWRWHFGTGITPSIDNFGILGESPSNQPLLDWLAADFMNNGWSIKNLHRKVVTSQTYRQSSAQNDVSALKDSGGRLFSRWVPKRLEAEAIRDSLLAVSGKLDMTMGGSLLTVKNRDYFFDHTSKDMTTYDSFRRSIYLPVVRNNLYEVTQLFDGTDATVSNGNRFQTTVATQALFFLNSPLMLDAADALAIRASAGQTDASKKIVTIYQAALGRPATEAEMESGKRFIRMAQESPAAGDTRSKEQIALAALAQIVLSSNEFVTLR
jgi:cytochrome c553